MLFLVTHTQMRTYASEKSVSAEHCIDGKHTNTQWSPSFAISSWFTYWSCVFSVIRMSMFYFFPYDLCLRSLMKCVQTMPSQFIAPCTSYMPIESRQIYKISLKLNFFFYLWKPSLNTVFFLIHQSNSFNNHSCCIFQPVNPLWQTALRFFQA